MGEKSLSGKRVSSDIGTLRESQCVVKIHPEFAHHVRDLVWPVEFGRPEDFNLIYDSDLDTPQGMRARVVLPQSGRKEGGTEPNTVGQLHFCNAGLLPHEHHSASCRRHQKLAILSVPPRASGVAIPLSKHRVHTHG